MQVIGPMHEDDYLQNICSKGISLRLWPRTAGSGTIDDTIRSANLRLVKGRFERRMFASWVSLPLLAKEA